VKARSLAAVWFATAALAVATAALAGCGGSGGALDVARPDGPRTVTAPVIRAVDGDTILVRLDGQAEYVRYIGVDTPETVKPDTPVQCYGPQASTFNHRRTDGQTVRLVFDRERQDVYGRLLAYVFRGNDFLNADLARRGLARPLTIPPNTAHETLFAQLSRQAGRAGRGLWGKC
jgi:micrococcal nuclease